MLIGFLVLLAVIAIGVYVGLMMRVVPGFAEQRLGVVEPLPERIGEWLRDESDAGSQAESRGEVREIRYLYDPDAGLTSKGRLTLQVRYRDRESNEIIRTEPDAVVARKRIRSAG
ncbi:MAG: hypothetical protein R3B13_12565 [Polyangiaceae bacterium]